MALFISIILISVGLLLVGIGGNAWSRGGYDNVKLAGWWGIAGYLVFGFGAWFTYYSYVIKPARASVGPVEEPVTSKRPVLAVEGATLKKLPDGRGYVDIIVRNSGDALARNAIVHLSIAGIPVTEDNARDCPEPEKGQLETMPSVGVFGINERRSAGTGVILSAQDIASIVQQKTRLYVHLLSNYEGERNGYVLEFYARYDPITDGFKECQIHNTGT